MNEKSPLEDLVSDVSETTPGGHPIEKVDPKMEALSKLRHELADKDLYFAGERWELGEIFSDGRILLRRPGASQDDPVDTRERILSPEEFRASIEVVSRTQE